MISDQSRPHEDHVITTKPNSSMIIDQTDRLGGP
jgi:hypothetical protein